MVAASHERVPLGDVISHNQTVRALSSAGVSASERGWAVGEGVGFGVGLAVGLGVAVGVALGCGVASGVAAIASGRAVTVGLGVWVGKRAVG